MAYARHPICVDDTRKMILESLSSSESGPIGQRGKELVVCWDSSVVISF